MAGGFTVDALLFLYTWLHRLLLPKVILNLMNKNKQVRVKEL